VRAETLKGALARVAFQIHEEQERAPDREDKAADISRDRLWEELQAVLGSYDRAKQVTDYVQFRAGLLQAHDRFTYTFPHRTFQEYLAASHLWTMANPGQELNTRVRRDLTWWREVFLLAAGQQKTAPKNVAELVEWLLPAGPQGDVTPAQAALATLAGQALRETDFARHTRPLDPAYKFTVTLQRIKEWLQVTLTAAGAPVAERADAGRILGRITWPDGALLDDRPGVGVLMHQGVKVPDIAWGEWVRAGMYSVGGDPQAYNSFPEKEARIASDYRLARYPVTYAQFHCFVEADDFGLADWWNNIPAGEQKITEQAFRFWNHPRERVTWYQALAFCRWLSDKLKHELPVGAEIDLPHEYEWEVAARRPDNRPYPWGESFDPGKANTGESGLGQTTAVGMFPGGANPALGLFDLSGNVWEWCRNKYGDPDGLDAMTVTGATRTLRGGSWIDYHDYARAASRGSSSPFARNHDSGFRVVVRCPPSQ